MIIQTQFPLGKSNNGATLFDFISIAALISIVIYMAPPDVKRIIFQVNASKPKE